MAFRVGNRVQAVDELGHWVPGVVKSVADEKYTVHFLNHEAVFDRTVDICEIRSPVPRTEEIGETRRASLSAKATGDQLEHMLSLVIKQKVMVKDDDGEPKMAVVRQVDRFKNRFEVLMGGVVRTLHASRIAGRAPTPIDPEAEIAEPVDPADPGHPEPAEDSAANGPPPANSATNGPPPAKKRRTSKINCSKEPKISSPRPLAQDTMDCAVQTSPPQAGEAHVVAGRRVGGVYMVTGSNCTAALRSVGMYSGMARCVNVYDNRLDLGMEVIVHVGRLGKEISTAKMSAGDRRVLQEWSQDALSSTLENLTEPGFQATFRCQQLAAELRRQLAQGLDGRSGHRVLQLGLVVPGQEVEQFGLQSQGTVTFGYGGTRRPLSLLDGLMGSHWDVACGLGRQTRYITRLRLRLTPLWMLVGTAFFASYEDELCLENNYRRALMDDILASPIEEDITYPDEDNQ